MSKMKQIFDKALEHNGLVLTLRTKNEAYAIRQRLYRWRRKQGDDTEFNDVTIRLEGPKLHFSVYDFSNSLQTPSGEPVELHNERQVEDAMPDFEIDVASLFEEGKDAI